ncbi:MAG: DUF2207 domain-containing protein [Pygmaiobacter sp.]
MKRAASLLLCALLMVALLCTPVSAASSDAGYTIETYDVEATLEQDGSMQITERIGVNFELPSRGIFRAFPTSVQMEKETGGTTKVLRYTPKISVVSANDVVTTYTENGIFYIRFGTEDAWHQGAQEYEVQYTYDPGADRVPEYDELFYSFNGADWDTTIASFHFVLNFPKKMRSTGRAMGSPSKGAQTGCSARAKLSRWICACRKGTIPACANFRRCRRFSSLCPRCCAPLQHWYCAQNAAASAWSTRWNFIRPRA